MKTKERTELLSGFIRLKDQSTDGSFQRRSSQQTQDFSKPYSMILWDRGYLLKHFTDAGVPWWFGDVVSGFPARQEGISSGSVSEFWSGASIDPFLCQLAENDDRKWCLHEPDSQGWADPRSPGVSSVRGPASISSISFSRAYQRTHRQLDTSAHVSFYWMTIWWH